MSEFRIFCFGSFITQGVVAVLANRKLLEVAHNPLMLMLVVGFMGGCIAVVAFGERAK